MFWNPTHFPAAMRSLPPSVRAKAIEIANSMLEKGGPEKKEVISTSISEARMWARQRFIESGGFN
ncbi:DUF2188 domain-containing protein [Larkinella harenae]